VSDVQLTRSGGVATVFIDRPPVNALSSGLLRALAEVVEDLARDADLRCVVLTARGQRVFVAGADIKEAAETPPEQASERTALGGRLLIGVESLPVPVIAAINGLCLGGGCELALAADIRVAAENARFGQPEILLGIMPGFGGTQRLPRLIGAGPALDLLLTGRDIDAAEALRLGLVSRVVAKEQLQDEVAGMARAIAARSAPATRAIKAAVRQGAGLPLSDALGVEFALSNAVRKSPEALEGLRAFVARRAPDFRRPVVTEVD
jgi:enoyl-CoA hydratase